MDKGNILLLDGEDKLRALVRRVLTLEGFDVQEAATLRAAARLLEKQA